MQQLKNLLGNPYECLAFVISEFSEQQPLSRIIMLAAIFLLLKYLFRVRILKAQWKRLNPHIKRGLIKRVRFDGKSTEVEFHQKNKRN
jgi:hypothetical protein